MFFGKTSLKYESSFVIVPKMNLHNDNFRMGYHAPKQRSYAKVTTPGS
jgi:hypothetical protein